MCLPIFQKPDHLHKGRTNRGRLKEMTITVTIIVGLMGHKGTIMEPHVTIGDPTTTRADQISSIGVPSPSVSSVINGDILQNLVLNITPLMPPSIVLTHQVEWTKIGY